MNDDLPLPAVTQLATPLAWTDADGVLLGVNPAFCRWQGVSPRRLLGLPLAALERDGQVLEHFMARDQADQLRLDRLAMAVPGEAPRFAQGWLTRSEDTGWLLELHPVDEFPVADAVQALPNALHAALKGLAHELRNPLAGLKGAAQLLARSSAGRGADEIELVTLIGAEIERLNTLLEQLLNPTPPQPPAPRPMPRAAPRRKRMTTPCSA